MGVFGVGRIGFMHVENLMANPSVQVSAICDPFASDEVISRLGVALKTEDEIFDDADIDAVLIASATDTHYDLLKKAIATGKHIFCEKPVDLDIKKIIKIRDLAKKASSRIGVGLNRRHDPNFSSLKEAIESGAIGNLEMVNIISKDPYPPPISYVKSSGGLIRDMMIHDMDMFHFLIDDEIVEVYAQGANLVSEEIKAAGDIDTAMVFLKTKSGILGSISNSRRCVSGYDQRIEIAGSAGRINVENVPNNFLQITNDKGTLSSDYQTFFIDRYQDAYRIQMDKFIDYVNGGNPFSASLHDALRASQLAEMVIYSLENNQRVLTRDWDYERSA